MDVSNFSLSRFFKYALYALFAAGLFLLCLKVVNRAYHLRFFVDESTIVEAAYRLLTEGEYGTRFDPSVSTGIAVTWISGLVFLGGGSLFDSRVITSLFQIAQLFVLLYILVSSRIQVLPVRLGIMMIAVLMLLHFPYWFGFIHHLGELQGILFIGWALVAFRNKHPYMAFFLLGTAVWGCKLIYLVIAAALGLAYVIAAPTKTWRDKYWMLQMFVFLFNLPILLWLGIIYIQAGGTVFHDWIKTFFNFVGGHSGITYDEGFYTLTDRLRNLEWASYRFYDKMQILTWLVGPIILGPIILWRHMDWKKNGVTAWMILGTIAAMAVYAYWYFFISKQMWARHAQPALYVGFTALIIFGLQFKQWSEVQTRIWVPAAVASLLFFLVIWDIVGYRKLTPLDFKKDSFAAECRHAHGQDCPDFNR